MQTQKEKWNWNGATALKSAQDQACGNPDQKASTETFIAIVRSLEVELAVELADLQKARRILEEKLQHYEVDLLLQKKDKQGMKLSQNQFNYEDL